MAKKIERIAVLGAGVMGAQIAGHLAGCGFPVLLLDILPFDEPMPPETRGSDSWRNKIALSSLEKLKKSRPPALFAKGVIKLITPGNIEDHLGEACRCGWIIEAVPEKLKIKKDIYSKIDKLLERDLIISSNTSGISLSILTKGMSERLRRSFLITHFFNPVRYMKLVEVVAGPETSPEYVDEIKRLLSEDLAKGVVMAKDTPGFIANRIGVYTVMNAMAKTFDKKWPIDLVDKAMGKASSFANSAIFRTADLVGLDTLLFVAKNAYDLCPDDPFRGTLAPHPVVDKMVAGGKLGTKSGVGFYKKEAGNILVYNPAEEKYRPKASYDFDSLKEAKKINDPAGRVKAIFAADDEAAQIAKELILDILVYAAAVAEEIAGSVYDIDNAMKWGYNWGLGPFELWDAVGLDAAGDRVPELIKRLKSKGLEKFYGEKEGRTEYFDFASGGYEKVLVSPEKISIASRKRDGEVAKNAGASLADLGDGVLCCEFHSKMNSIDPDIIAIMNQGLDFIEAGKYAGLLIANDGADFSVGANIFMIAMAIASGDFKRIEDMVRAFQDVGQRMRFSPRPVVAAPFGRTLGGGCEVCLAAGNVVAAVETYIGLVELGVGLIPAGGGCKNLLLKMEERKRAAHNPKDHIWFSASDGGPFPKVADAFETIAMAKVAASGMDAIDLNYLSKGTKIVLDREKLTIEAKKFLLELAGDYKPPAPREDIMLPGRGGEMALVNRVAQLKAMGQITDYDRVLAENLAHVLCGGDVATGHLASEQDILDLEREVFLKLCFEKRTAERIQHMLTTGKPLRN